MIVSFFEQPQQQGEDVDTCHVFVFLGDVEAVSETGCQSAVWIGLLIGVVLLSLSVIFLLVLKICRYRKSSEKKEEPSLWVDKPLVTRINAED